MSPVSFKKPIKNFIVLEGLDGCGTTTQTGLLAEKLEKAGIDAIISTAYFLIHLLLSDKTLLMLELINSCGKFFKD